MVCTWQPRRRLVGKPRVHCLTSWPPTGNRTTGSGKVVRWSWTPWKHNGKQKQRDTYRIVMYYCKPNLLTAFQCHIHVQRTSRELFWGTTHLFREGPSVIYNLYFPKMGGFFTIYFLVVTWVFIYTFLIISKTTRVSFFSDVDQSPARYRARDLACKVGC